jgi:hypothetical protein
VAVLVSRPDVKSRPPAGNRKGGPDSYVITTVRIPAQVPAPRALPTVTLADLPPTIRARTKVDPLSGCWRCCLGYLDPDGYAQFRGRMAHRVVWERLVGPIPDGYVIDHVARLGCIWRCCLWPLHLEPVTIATNNMRSRNCAGHQAARLGQAA